MKSYNIIDDTYDEIEDPELEADETSEESSEGSTDKSNEIVAQSPIDDDTWQVFGELKIDESYSIGNVHGTKNIYERYELSKLDEDLYRIFEESPYKDTFKKKKPAKGDILEIVLYFLDRIQEPETYSYCEKIVAIADMMKIDYLMLFNELPSAYRYNVIKELNDQYGVVKSHSKKLF